jgi:hypothetical protein
MKLELEGFLIILAGAMLGAIILAFGGPLLITPITKAITGTA